MFTVKAREPFAVATNRQLSDARGMASEALTLLTGRYLPQLDTSVGTTTHNEVAIGRYTQRPGDSCLRRECSHLTTRADIPNPQGSIAMCRYQMGSTGCK